MAKKQTAKPKKVVPKKTIKTSRSDVSKKASKKKTTTKKSVKTKSSPKKVAPKKPIKKRKSVQKKIVKQKKESKKPVVISVRDENSEALSIAVKKPVLKAYIRASSESPQKNYLKPKLSVVRLVEIGLLMILLTLSATLLFTHTVVSPDANQQVATVTLTPQTRQVSGRYLFSGTIVWDRNIEEWSKNEGGVIDPSQPFQNLESYQPEQYDAWIADLECPISDIDVPYEVGLRTFEFNCRPEYLEYAAQYFNFFNLANNHADNSGRMKLEETRQKLSALSIQYFGDPDPGLLDDICEIVGLPVNLTIQTAESTEIRPGYFPIAFCAWHYFLRLPQVGEIELLKQYAEVMPVFAFLHMGTEYQTRANVYQEQVARSIIDAGAEFVIANNPHYVQNAEVYKDKLIVYSTGNFIFDQTWSREVSSSASIDTSVIFEAGNQIDEWLAIGEQCTAYKDDCFERITQADLQKPNLKFTYELIAGTITESRPQTKAEPDIQAFVEERLGWPAVLEGLTD